MCGQALINLLSLLPFSTPDEAEVAPLEHRLRSSTGASFPMAVADLAERLAVRMQQMVGVETALNSQ